MTELTNAHTEEVKDHAKYVGLAKIAEELNCHHVHGVLLDIAREESIHAKLISEILEEAYHDRT